MIRNLVVIMCVYMYQKRLSLATILRFVFSLRKLLLAVCISLYLLHTHTHSLFFCEFYFFYCEVCSCACFDSQFVSLPFISCCFLFLFLLL